ncbi:hypothetical protein [Acidithiobacillus caldus]|uniref:hypothetical protein n=1 Tax=Acidithiobacillus caldus TaxID=33059 RepID=UPI00146FC882|nr:hypothetical protein [Acidithiobacillus caldus]MBU2730305.1 hypothetical protein [Acidithiobacillus caldus]MBU2736125.1 hypothetical protein [Acidithiobacillus caldus ATCC 51756]MBU2745386.1 hypothetical protein [Acidithiobacillus caldus]MBU2780269.1 hypothetical protein [Acidithiobacillus caldus]
MNVKSHSEGNKVSFVFQHHSGGRSNHIFFIFKYILYLLLLLLFVKVVVGGVIVTALKKQNLISAFFPVFGVAFNAVILLIRRINEVGAGTPPGIWRVADSLHAR